MGIRRKATPVSWRIMVPVEIAVKIELLLMDPTRGKPEYGARSQLITELLTEYLNRIGAKNGDTSSQ